MDEFEDIYVKYANDVKRFLIYLTHDVNLAEELTQETFYQAVKSINRYNGKCNMKVWLCQIAKYRFYDHLKKQKHYHKVSLDEMIDLSVEFPSSDVNPIDNIIQEENIQKIYKYIKEMKEPYREIFMIRIYNKLSFREIGEIFEKSENWARVTYYRTKTKLLERMKSDNYEM